MATGLLYDVHGNLPALDAVLRDARGTPVRSWVLGGDYASFGAWPAEVVERLGELQDATWIRGNWDRWQAGVDDADMPDVAPLQGARRMAVARLGPELVARLAALPATHRDGDTLYCHGSPRSDTGFLLPEHADGDAEQLAGAGAARVVFGHTHLAFTRSEDGIVLVNPGSIGMPFDGDRRASWALLHDDGRVEHRRVEYDVEEACAGLAERFRGEAWIEGTALRLRAARFDVGDG